MSRISDGRRPAAGADRPWDRFSPSSPPTSDRHAWIPTDLLDYVEQVTAGITDTTSLAQDGSPKVIIDWKSDVNPAAEAVEYYRAQVRSYLRTMGIANGLIVFVTSGIILPVRPLADQETRPLAVGS